jgi:hypothetical protein
VPGRRCWAVEGAGSYGAGLTRPAWRRPPPPPTARGWWLRIGGAGCCSILDPHQWLEPHCSFLRNLHRPLQRCRGPVHNADLHPLPWKSVRPSRTRCSLSTTRPAVAEVELPDRRLRPVISLAPGTWSGTPRPSIPAGRPPTSCCDRIRTSACGSSTIRSRIWPAPPDPSSKRRSAGLPEAERVSKVTSGR